MLTQMKTITPKEAWTLANQHDWETDTRFEQLHQAICDFYLAHNNEEDEEGEPNGITGRDVTEIFIDTMEEEFGVTFDVDDDTEIDIYDELTDLAYGNYAALPNN